jgi:Fur family transcriptional regulator, ferric uptake regulator
MEFEGIEEVLAILREKGHRVSTPGRLVLEALFAVDGPVSAQFIAEGLAGKGARLELTSVYRNLERLEDLGVVKHFHLGHGPGLYMLVGSGDKEFLSCERCGRVTSVDPSQLDPVRRQIRKRFGYQARFGHFPIIGLCESCTATEAHEAPEDPGRYEQEHSHGYYVHSHPHGHTGSGPHSHRHRT